MTDCRCETRMSFVSESTDPYLKSLRLSQGTDLLPARDLDSNLPVPGLRLSTALYRLRDLACQWLSSLP